MEVRGCTKCGIKFTSNVEYCPKCNRPVAVFATEAGFLSSSKSTQQYIKGQQKLKNRKRAEEYDKIREQKQLAAQSNLPKCPYCQSTNLKKITTGGRMLSVGFFGLASGKIGKNFHCNNCGADF